MPIIAESINHCHLLQPIVHEQIIAAREERNWDVPMHDYASQHLATMSEEELDKDWKLNDFFGTIYVINLPDAKARLITTTQELKNIGVTKFKIFPAINGRKDVDSSIWKKFNYNRDEVDPDTEEGKQALDWLHQGEAGCYLSHFKLIQRTKHAFDNALRELNAARAQQNKKGIKRAEEKMRQYSRILIFEDDIGFGFVDETRISVDKKGTGRLLREAILNLPEEWDMLYFMVQATEPTEEPAPHLRKMNKSWGTVAYAIHYTMYAPLVKVLKQIENPHIPTILPVDHQISQIHFLHKVYAIFPSIVFHQAGPSQISSNEMHRLLQSQPIYSP